MAAIRTLQYSEEEDKAFVVTVPALPGCMTHGATTKEAVKMAEEAIEAIGDDPAPPEDVDRTFSGRVLLRLPTMLHRSLDRAATKEGTSLNQYIVNLSLDWLRRRLLISSPTSESPRRQFHPSFDTPYPPC